MLLLNLIVTNFDEIFKTMIIRPAKSLLLFKLLTLLCIIENMSVMSLLNKMDFHFFADFDFTIYITNAHILLPAVK
jgi:hypothetical protein